MSALQRIEHVVVLMLENRSFDCMLGRLYPGREDFNGLAGTESNPGPDGRPIPVAPKPGTDAATMSTPAPDPGELFTDINEQLFGTKSPAPGQPADMSGFARNYAGQARDGAAYDPQNVLHYYTPDQVPVISTLAKSFAVCDGWHASAPCQTWPNRFFAHTGTANGYENNSPVHFPYEMETIYNRFDATGKSDAWKIYFHDMPQAMTLSRLWLRADRFRFYEEFKSDARNGTLPSYSFIEPRYFTDVSLPNDQHPPHVVTLGEQLLAEVYECLRNGPKWKETLFILTYDEHGGCYDHVPPPTAVPPGGAITKPFKFDRYGVRVPAVIVSPFIPAGTILRSPAGQPPFDHTSILATLRQRFSLGAALSRRDAAAPTLAEVLSLPEPSNDGPDRIEALPYVASPGEVARAHALPLNGMQRALLQTAGHLPATVSKGDFASFIDAHIGMLRSGLESGEDSLARDVVSAAAFIRTRLGNLFKSL